MKILKALRTAENVDGSRKTRLLRDGPSFEVMMSIHRDTVVSLFIFMLLVCDRRVILKR